MSRTNRNASRAATHTTCSCCGARVHLMNIAKHERSARHQKALAAKKAAR